MKIKNLNIRSKASAILLAGTITFTSSTLLTGCGNQQIITTKRTFNRAVIFDYENKIASIIKVKSWKKFENNEYLIQTTDNLWILTSLYDTKLFDDENSDITVEDFALSILGENAEINYLTSKEKTRTR